MDTVSSDALEDPRYRVPAVPADAPAGLGWLRASIVRFSEGPDHERRRALVLAALDEVADAPYRASPTVTLLVALGLAPELEADVALVAAAYQPHAAQSAQADAAADRLVAAAGGRTEAAAARVCLLVQAHAGTSALVERLRAGSDEAPLPQTWRVGPDGKRVAVDLSDAHFGRGTHDCPGEELARRLAGAAVDQPPHVRS